MSDDPQFSAELVQMNLRRPPGEDRVCERPGCGHLLRAHRGGACGGEDKCECFRFKLAPRVFLEDLVRQAEDTDWQPVGSARATQVDGDHYAKRSVQPWDIAAAYPEMDPLTYLVIRYLLRWRDKNGITDLRKAAHTLAHLIEVEGAKAAEHEVE